MDFDWLFHRGDLPKDKVVDHMATYNYCKTSRGQGPASTSYTDEDWRHVQLPHDYLIEGTPSKEENSNKGAYPRPNAWYRKYFRLMPEDQDKRLTISFEGIATHSVVYLNGHLIYRSFSGYTGFEVDITDFARFGDELNVLAVYVKNHESEGWWYEGAGIYRHVWLIKTGKVSVDTWGTFVRTNRVQTDIWDTIVDTELRNDLDHPVSGHLFSSVYSDSGILLGQTETEFCMESREKRSFKQSITVICPALWSPDAPNMHTLHTQVVVDQDLLDDYITPFGYRTLRFDSDDGFFLNDQPMKIKGLCVHQDHGGVGTAVPDSVQEFRVRVLKSAGANALRSTHNPAPPSLLDACDRLGMMVMDENRWLVSSEARMHELESMIRRGRNHPSIILWSVFNEDPIMEKPAGSNMFRSLYALAEKLDDTRAIIGAPNINVGAEDYMRSSQVMGFNYNFNMVDCLHRCWQKPHINTETHQGNYSGGNDGWRLAALRPYVMGIFCWGVETRGETDWPRLFAPWGIVDSLCYPKSHYELYRNSYWANRPSIKVVPMLNYPKISEINPDWTNVSALRRSIHWNPRELTGKTVDVWVYTNLPRVELYLNGRSLGIQYADPFEQACWHVPYEPGELLAVGLDANGHEIVRDIMHTTSAPVSLEFKVHNDRLLADGEDCAIITAYAVDADGRFVPDADGIEVSFSVSEQGTILATANNEPTDHHSPLDPAVSLWNGMCQLIVRSNDLPGDLVLTASSSKLGNAQCRIAREHGQWRARVKDAPSCFVSHIDVSNYRESLKNAYAEDSNGELVWTAKRLDKRLLVNLPAEFNALAYRLDLTVPNTKPKKPALFFDGITGRLHIQVLNEQEQIIAELRNDNTEGNYTLDLSMCHQGQRIRIYIRAEIDSPTYFGPNPYNRHIGICGYVRWLNMNA